MGGTSNTRLDGHTCIIDFVKIVENSSWYKSAKAYVQSAIHEVGNLDSFQRIGRSLVKDTNPGRLIMIYLYAEELKKIIPDQIRDIEIILQECLQEGFMEMIRFN